jgi:hypothetical protein
LSCMICFSTAWANFKAFSSLLMSVIYSPSVTLSLNYTEKWYIMPDQLLLNMPFFRARMPYNQLFYLRRSALAMFLLPRLNFSLCIPFVVCLNFDTCSANAYSLKRGHAVSSSGYLFGVTSGASISFGSGITTLYSLAAHRFILVK